MTRVRFDLSSFTGVNQMIDRISTLETKMQKKITFKAATQAANIIKKKAIENAKSIDDGTSEDKIFPFIKVKRSPRASNRLNSAVVKVGVEGGAKYSTRTPPTYWRFVEFGTEDTPARSFMRDAMNGSEMAVFTKFYEVFFSEINKATGGTP